MTDRAKPERPRDGVTPFLTIADGRGSEALAFYSRAFGGDIVEQNPAEDGKRLMQASLRINGGWVMLSDEFPEWMGGRVTPTAGGGDVASSGRRCRPVVGAGARRRGDGSNADRRPVLGGPLRAVARSLRPHLVDRQPDRTVSADPLRSRTGCWRSCAAPGLRCGPRHCRSAAPRDRVRSARPGGSGTGRRRR